MKRPATQHLLVIYSALLTVAFAVLVLTGAAAARGKASFDELTVQRINVVEPDGTLRLVISNTAAAPGILFHGREYAHPDGRKTAGLIFYNDEGSENGGLVFDGRKDKGGKVSSHGHLSFDAYEQDQTLVVEADQDASEQKASFIEILDQPQYSLEELLRQLAATHDLPQAQQRAQLEQLMKNHPPRQPRVLLGRLPDAASELALKDAQGRNRILIKVSADGTPTLQILDAGGQVIDQMPRPAPN